jgi:hypothetical protein
MSLIGTSRHFVATRNLVGIADIEQAAPKLNFMSSAKVEPSRRETPELSHEALFQNRVCFALATYARAKLTQ